MSSLRLHLRKDDKDADNLQHEKGGLVESVFWANPTCTASISDIHVSTCCRGQKPSKNQLSPPSHNSSAKIWEDIFSRQAIWTFTNNHPSGVEMVY